MELIYCLEGNRSFAEVAIAAGFRYGARLPGRTYFPLFFADQDWITPDRKKYMACLQEQQPHTATVLDWEYEEQLAEVLDWAAQAAKWCRRLVIIPKVPGGISSLPRTIEGIPVILGYSVPTTYGGTTLGLWEFQGWPVHLLGGSPHKQMELACYLNVVSADGNMHHQQAHKGRFWSRERNEKGHWWQLSDAGIDSRNNVNLKAFALSCQNITTAWRNFS